MNQSRIQSQSIQAYAADLRRSLLGGQSISALLELHKKQQEMLYVWAPQVRKKRQHPADGFAWEFIHQVQVLRPDFKPEAAKLRSLGQGVFQNFTQRVLQVKALHFPQMDGIPKIRWLSKFTTRKLAHYNATKDEVAFSLIFDHQQAPSEVLNYLVFHELLHRQIGVVRKNGRLSAHTKEFRQCEQSYPGYEVIDQQIREFILARIQPQVT